MRYLLFSLCLAAASLAQAQVDPADLMTSEGLYGLVETYRVSKPDLNLAACTTDAPTNIEINITHNSPPLVPTESVLRVWFENSDDTECTNPASSGDDAYLGDVTLTIDPLDPFFAGEDAVWIPDDLADGEGFMPTLTDYSVVYSEGACGDEGGKKTITLCVGLDENKNGQIDTTTLLEPHGWVRLDIDTKPPPQPDRPTTTPLDGKLRVAVQVSGDGDTDDIDEYRGFMRELTASDVTCDEIRNDPEVRKGSVDASGPGRETFSIAGSNGVPYEVCVVAVDNVSNTSLGSEVATGTPQEECDFGECYPPGKLKGNCSATGVVPVWFIIAMLGVRRLRRGPARECDK
ncbi:hypothetical protein ACFL6C_11500 [Myxococcota bacterium]